MSFQTGFWAVLVAYLLATSLYLMRLILGRPGWAVAALRVTVAATALQAAVLVAHFVINWPVFDSYLDFFQISGFALAVLFIGLCFKRRFYAAGPMFLTIIDVLLIVSLTSENPYHIGVIATGSLPLFVHMAMIFLSLPAFAVAFVTAVLYLIADRQIKAKRFDGWAGRLPPLLALEDVHSKALNCAFVLFTAVILTGAGYSKVMTGHYLAKSPKEALSALTWIYLAVFLNLRFWRGWLGRPGMMVSLAGFIGVFAAFCAGLA